MAETMTRTDALRDLIERVEAGTLARASDTWRVFLSVLLINPGHVTDAYQGDLNAVARLEAPLRERGWLTDVAGPALHDPLWGARQERLGEVTGGGIEIWGHAPTEARARLAAVLRAMLHEAQPSET